MLDGDIEYLEEDEELVHHCIETIHQSDEPELLKPLEDFSDTRVSPSSLLEERIIVQNNLPAAKRKWSVREDHDFEYQPNFEEEDSDYDPLETERKVQKQKRQRKTKREPQNPKPILKPAAVFLPMPLKVGKVGNKPKPPPPTLKLNRDIAIKPVKKHVSNKDLVFKIPVKSPQTCQQNAKNARNNMIEILNRQKLSQTKRLSKNLTPKQVLQKLAKKPVQKRSNLPDLVIKKIANANPLKKLHSIALRDYNDPKCINAKRLKDKDAAKIWNATCEKQLTKIQSQNVSTAKTMQFLRKVHTKVDGKTENVIRLHYSDKYDGKKDTIQALLPRFESTNCLEVHFKTGKSAKDTADCRNTMILTKETSKDGAVLVAFSAKEYRATTYELVKNENTENESGKTYTRMLMSCRMCVECYQYSWRGSKAPKVTSDIKCAICDSTFTSAYNLLSHVRCHKLSADDKRRQNRILAKIMRYHYVCRICRHKADSIPDLRKHLRFHGGIEKFYCEVGQHFAN